MDTIAPQSAGSTKRSSVKFAVGLKDPPSFISERRGTLSGIPLGDMVKAFEETKEEEPATEAGVGRELKKAKSREPRHAIDPGILAGAFFKKPTKGEEGKETRKSVFVMNAAWGKVKQMLRTIFVLTLS